MFWLSSPSKPIKHQLSNHKLVKSLPHQAQIADTCKKANASEPSLCVLGLYFVIKLCTTYFKYV